MTVLTSIGFAAVFMMVFAVTAATSAQSMGLSDDMLTIIRTRCSNSQFALQQIEKRDAVSRINRGRAYDQMLRQTSALNSRFAYNKISSPDLLQITTDLQVAVDAFRANYDRYDSDITDALKVNCKEKPAEYYDIIVRARNDRNAVGEQADKIAQLMTNYRDALLRYKEAL